MVAGDFTHLFLTIKRNHMHHTTRNQIISILTLLAAMPAGAQTVADTSDHLQKEMGEVVVTSRGLGQKRMKGALNGTIISKAELLKAACCNLGESFTTNPSVDVNYSDAATGAKQIKLLGLSGTYVQMLAENLPAYRGAAAPYALGFIPGQWLQSIQVSKGNASVKNGYESITGQINVEYAKPEDTQGVEANLYANTEGKIEANAVANTHLSKPLATELLAHYEKSLKAHDGNGDGFIDQPKVEQVNLQNRWIWKGDRYIFHGGVQLLKEWRDGGQHGSMPGMDRYTIGIDADHYEAYMKHAFILNPEHGTNVALMGNVSMHKMDANYGAKTYWVNQKNAYAALMLEHNFTPEHSISAGFNLTHDYLGQRYLMLSEGQSTRHNEHETVPGGYVQYTLNLADRFTAMAGLRVDHSTEWGTFVTPRFHLKWQVSDHVGLRASAGKGYRTVHPLAEFNYLLASSRNLVIDDLKQERAWNYGMSAQLSIPLWGDLLRINGEYYFTRFNNQAVIDFDSDPHTVHIANLQGRSYSHVWQVDASYTIAHALSLTAAYRRNLVRETYEGVRREKPLQSRYKALLTASWKSNLELWQADVTLQINGPGRMPTPYTLPDGSASWSSHFHAHPTLNAQITRAFRHFSIYVGGENLTGYKQKHPVIGADDPWGKNFDTLMVFGPTMGAMGYVGVRINFGKL